MRNLSAEMNPDTKLAPRTIRNIYGMPHTLFVDAKVEPAAATFGVTQLI